MLLLRSLMDLYGICIHALLVGILYHKLLNYMSTDMDALCCALPDELRVKILYYLRFDNTALMELQKTRAFNSLILIKDSYGKIVHKISFANNASFIKKYLYHASVRHLFTLREFFPNTWTLRCIEDPVDFLFSDDDY